MCETITDILSNIAIYILVGTFVVLVVLLGMIGIVILIRVLVYVIKNGVDL